MFCAFVFKKTGNDRDSSGEANGASSSHPLPFVPNGMSARYDPRPSLIPQKPPAFVGGDPEAWNQFAVKREPTSPIFPPPLLPPASNTQFAHSQTVMGAGGGDTVWNQAAASSLPLTTMAHHFASPPHPKLPVGAAPEIWNPGVVPNTTAVGAFGFGVDGRPRCASDATHANSRLAAYRARQRAFSVDPRLPVRNPPPQFAPSSSANDQLLLQQRLFYQHQAQVASQQQQRQQQQIQRLYDVGPFNALVERIEAQMPFCMETIRNAIMSTIQEQITYFSSENLALRQTVANLRHENHVLGMYRQTLYELRPFFKPDMWERIEARTRLPENADLQQLQMQQQQQMQQQAQPRRESSERSRERDPNGVFS